MCNTGLGIGEMLKMTPSKPDNPEMLIVSRRPEFDGYLDDGLKVLTCTVAGCWGDYSFWSGIGLVTL